uniref:S1 motif domain-containing protein n=1 Tax=viral metagenome TaxID=1070528 RepID=A0A6C0CI59_9ZZZZ
MDPLFERRELEKKVHIDSKFLQKNMQASILAQLKMNYEGICSAEGFIERNSITLLNYSLGRTNYTKGGTDYDVKFQADVCLPHPGQKLKARVTVRSKVGIHAETPPIKVLIPRDLYFGNDEFAKIEEGQDIEFEVVGSQFKQKDTEIIVVGKLLNTVLEGSVPVPEVSTSEPILVTSTVSQEGEKQVVIMPTMSEPEKKKRKLKKDTPTTTVDTLPSPPV